MHMPIENFRSKLSFAEKYVLVDSNSNQNFLAIFYFSFVPTVKSGKQNIKIK